MGAHTASCSVLMPGFLTDSCCVCRHGFQHVVEISERLVGILKRGGSDKVADMDELFKREALDVIGRPRQPPL